MKRLFIYAALLLLTLLNNACSVRAFAVKKIGDAVANSGRTFTGDGDPQLIRDAVPFSLKLIESLLAETPRHRGLLLAAARGFTQYAYAFVQEEGDEIETQDLAKARELHARARGLYLRARDYGLRGLEVKDPAFGKTVRHQPKAAVAKIRSVGDVPLLYWTAAAWGAAISISKDDPELIADQPVVEALIDQALRLDAKFESGAIYGFLISYEQARQGAAEDAAQRSRKHFERAMALSDGKLASPLVAFAEAVCVTKQDRAEFQAMLKQALAIDPNLRPEWKLENLVMQRRAQWLLSRTDELFAD